MEKHSSIIQAEAIATIVGLVLIAMLITIVVVLVFIYVTKQKMKARSQFTIHVARNFNDASRDKETPVSDFDRQSLRNQAPDADDFMTESLDNPLYEHTTSFTGATYEVATTGFTNPQDDQDNSGSDVSIPISKETVTENDYQVPTQPVPVESTDAGSISKHPANSPVKIGSALNQDAIDHDYQVPSHPVVAGKAPVALPRGPATQSPRRPAPMLPIIRPKVYANLPPSNKPPVSAKPHKQPVLPPAEKPSTKQPVQPPAERPSTKPGVKPKPRAVPRNL